MLQRQRQEFSLLPQNTLHVFFNPLQSIYKFENLRKISRKRFSSDTDFGLWKVNGNNHTHVRHRQQLSSANSLVEYYHHFSTLISFVNTVCTRAYTAKSSGIFHGTVVSCDVQANAY